MGGRLICFTSIEGQNAPCIRDDEDCFNCSDAKRMIQGVHSGELSYAAAMKIVRAAQYDKNLLMEFVNYIWNELHKRGILRGEGCVDEQSMNVLIGRFLVDRKRPAPRVTYNYGKHPERYLVPLGGALNDFLKIECAKKLEDYVDYCYGFLSPACGFCEVEPSVEHCTKCDVFLRQV